MATVDQITFLRLAYDLSGSDHEWLTRMTRASVPVLDRGLGVIAYAFDMSCLDRPRVWDIENVGVARRVFDAALRTLHEQPAAHAKLKYRPGARVELRSVALGERHMGRADPLRDGTGVADVLSLGVSNDARRGIAITAASPRLEDPGQVRLRGFREVAAHLGPALRLRDSLQAPTRELAELGQHGAILDDAGRLHHASGRAKERNARDTLRELARTVDRTRTGAVVPENPDRLWRAVLDGEWALVDSFELGGRRFFIVSRSPSTATNPRALTKRERRVAELALQGHSLKHIAADLELDLSTVSWHLKRIAKKLGASNRVELMRLLLQIEQAIDRT